MSRPPGAGHSCHYAIHASMAWHDWETLVTFPIKVRWAHVTLTNEAFQYKRKKKRGRKEKKGKNRKKETQPSLDAHPILVPSSSNKNNIYIYIKPTSRTTDQNTDQKKNERKTFQIRFSCFYLETATTNNPTCHNKLTNKKLTLWWRGWNFPMVSATVSLLRVPARGRADEQLGCVLM